MYIILQSYLNYFYSHNLIIEGVFRLHSNRADGKRLSASRAYLYPAMGRPNLHVAVHAHVQKVSSSLRQSLKTDSSNCIYILSRTICICYRIEKKQKVQYNRIGFTFRVGHDCEHLDMLDSCCVHGVFFIGKSFVYRR